MIEHLELKNFTVFNSLELDLSPRVNVVIGENGTLVNSLFEKYLFPFFFCWAECRLEKSVHYASLITLDSPMLLPIIDRLERQRTNLSSKSVRWDREPLASCQVHNIDTWHVEFPNWPVTRLSVAVAKT